MSDTFSTGTALEPEERELVKRLLEFPGVVREATERRAVHAIPIYAIRVADDFHRFYHEHRVLESENERFGCNSAPRPSPSWRAASNSSEWRRPERM